MLRNRLFLLLLGLLEVNSLLFASRNDQWKDIETIETATYIWNVPKGWQRFPNMSKGQEQVFQTQNDDLPDSALSTSYISVFNNISSMADLLSTVEKSYVDKPVTYNREKYKSSVFLKILFPKFNGRPNVLYQFLIFSEDEQKGYVCSLNIRDINLSQEYIRENKTEDYAKEIFKRFKLK